MHSIAVNRIVGLLAAILVVISGCSSGPAAPSAAPDEQVCTETFCITLPAGWTTEVGETYISASHVSAPDTTFLTAGVINMRAIVETAGGSWPAPTEDVTRAFWSLLEDADVGKFERSARMVGGAERSWGVHDDGEMWHLVYPTGPSSAIGIELRAPNDSWETHADEIFASVTVR